MVRKTTAIYRIEKCADGSTNTVVLDRGDCVALLAVWAAANEVVRFNAPWSRSDDDCSRPVRRLRDAVKVLDKP